MLAKPRIGLLGGSFNPAHAGHIHISLQAMKRLNLSEIWWLVSPQNPLKIAGDLADYHTRFKSAEALTDSHPRIHVLDIEEQLGLTYTIDTITLLQTLYPKTQFVWLMGADNLAGFHRWHRWRAIAARIPIAVLDRAPYGMRALHQRFVRVFSYARLTERDAGKLAFKQQPSWVYLSIPRHPLSATHLRKTLGQAAFMRHNAAK